MNRRRFLAVLPVALLALSGCPTPSDSDNSPLPSDPRNAGQRSEGAFKDLDPWILKTNDPSASRGNHGIYLSNGYLGASFNANSTGDKDTRAFITGNFDENEALASIPNWPVYKELSLLAPGANYEQSLDLKRGVLTTRLGTATADVFLSAAEPQEAWLQVTGAKLTDAQGKRDTMVGQGAMVDRESRPTDTGWVTRTRVGTKLPESGAGQPLVFADALKAHEAAWAKRWAGRDIVIEGDPEAQQLVHKLLFDLIQSIHPDGSFSIAPEALAGNFYKGHVFWDAEVWMFPALLAQHPDLARSMLDYRFLRLEQAKAQAAKGGFKGADFPWESASTGKETVTGTFTAERHVTAGIGWAVWQYWLATNDTAWMNTRGWPLLSNIADFWASRATKTARGWEIQKVIGPDELQAIPLNNNAYTNAMAVNCLKAATSVGKALRKPVNPKWAEVARGMYFPKNAQGVILKCDEDQGKKGTKQADGELLLWPAQHPDADAKTFDFHKDRPIKNGPAMTDSVHALISARLGRAADAEKEFRESYRPFVRGPFLLFSEKRSLDRCVFTTGCGGVLQAVLYGFGGLDFAHWDTIEKAPLALPKGWTKLEIQGIHYRGKRYKLTVTPQGRKLTPQ